MLYKDKKIKESFFCTVKKNDPWDKAVLSKKIFKETKQAINNSESLSIDFKIENTDRSVGGNVSGYIAEKYGENGLTNPVELNFTGSAGQSFGCWNANGLNLILDGDANDYVGKGMNGGKIVIKNKSNYASHKNNTVLAGNTCLYGATGGEVYISGTVGERTFFDKCNRGLVNLERITTEDMQPHRKHLKEIIENHYKYTGSAKAKDISDDFEKYEPYFWLVMPAASNIRDLLKATTANAA